MKRFVEVVVNVPRIQGTFHYHIPPELEAEIRIGQLVMIPFGERLAQGIVLREVDTPEVAETRPLSAIIDPEAVVTRAQIRLAEYIAEYNLGPLAACMGLMLPPGLTRMTDTEYILLEKNPPAVSGLQKRIIQMLQKRGNLRGRQIEYALSRLNWKKSAQKLQDRQIIQTRPVLPLPRVRPKTVRTARLMVGLEEALETIRVEGSQWRTRYEPREKAIQMLAREAVSVEVNWVYAESGCKLADLRKLAELDLVLLSEEEAWRDPLAGISYDPSIPLTLTSEQARAYQIISRQLAEPGKPVLLHGVTGSGKTELYLQAAAQVLAQGKQVIMLVPEIALTPQTVRRFMGRFPGQVGLIHSRLSMGERYDTWRRARQGRLRIIVGPRSALFAPLPDIGLIVVDECHDTSYAQSDRPPNYHATDLAVEYARQLQAACILGSATPRVETRYRAEHGEFEYIHLPSRILAHQETIRQYTKTNPNIAYQPLSGLALTRELPEVEVVDLRAELAAGNRSPLSRSLLEALQQTLAAGQQAILFLNRRGTSTYIFCRDCGYTLLCPRCETPLTWHEKQEKLNCHHCSYERNFPESCPVCGSVNIRQLGLGTQRLESLVQEAMPHARLLRWDQETTSEKGSHDIILSHFSNQKADILIGTQMLAKGLDLPFVTLVGVVLADVGLFLPDFRATERVFQVLTQVAGRAGRSPLGGKVILQTYNPENPVIQAASRHDYDAFYEQEVLARRQLAYPPFSQMVRLLYRHQNILQAEEEAERMGREIESLLAEQNRVSTTMIGPAPCFYQRLDGQFRWQIILRGPKPVEVIAGMELGDWQVQVDPQDLL